MNDRFYPISKEKFDEIVLPLIVSFQNRSGRPTLISHYTFFCAIFYVLRTGVSWRDIPTEFGSWHTIYTRFKRWSESGLFWDSLYRLQQNKQIKVDIAWVDSTTIALHRHGGGSLKKRGIQCKGRGRKGLSTKIHVSLSPGKLNNACLSEGQRVDMKLFRKLFETGHWDGIEYIIADKGYDFSEVRTPIKEAHKTAVIPRRKGAVFPGVRDSERYKTRSSIERFFSHLKENKRMALRFDKLDVTFFSFFALACMKILKLFC